MPRERLRDLLLDMLLAAGLALDFVVSLRHRDHLRLGLIRLRRKATGFIATSENSLFV